MSFMQKFIFLSLAPSTVIDTSELTTTSTDVTAATIYQDISTKPPADMAAITTVDGHIVSTDRTKYNLTGETVIITMGSRSDLKDVETPKMTDVRSVYITSNNIKNFTKEKTTNVVATMISDFEVRLGNVTGYQTDYGSTKRNDDATFNETRKIANEWKSNATFDGEVTYATSMPTATQTVGIPNNAVNGTFEVTTEILTDDTTNIAVNGTLEVTVNGTVEILLREMANLAFEGSISVTVGLHEAASVDDNGTVGITKAISKLADDMSKTVTSSNTISATHVAASGVDSSTSDDTHQDYTYGRSTSAIPEKTGVSVNGTPILATSETTDITFNITEGGTRYHSRTNAMITLWNNSTAETLKNDSRFHSHSTLSDDDTLLGKTSKLQDYLMYFTDMYVNENSTIPSKYKGQFEDYGKGNFCIEYIYCSTLP